MLIYKYFFIYGAININFALWCDKGKYGSFVNPSKTRLEMMMLCPWPRTQVIHNLVECLHFLYNLISDCVVIYNICIYVRPFEIKTYKITPISSFEASLTVTTFPTSKGNENNC